MYVRINSDKSGRLYIEQLLTLSEVKNGVTQPAKPKWEKVPTVGVEGMETYNLPVGMSCGVMLLKKKETQFDIGKGQIETEITYAVSALDIYRIQDQDGCYTRFFTREKDSFVVKMPTYLFIETILKLLTEFKVLKFDINGNLNQGE